MKYKMNPDKDFVKEMKDSLKSNNGYCPCQFKSPDSKCPCKNFRVEVKEGYCMCGLYYKD